MQTRETKVWFSAKKYGWGWGFPCCWQGWAVWLVWFILLFGGGIILAPRNIVLFVVYSVGLGAALIIVSFVKGEKPRWRWGEDQGSETQSTADRLARLEELHRRKLVSDTEYETKRREILKEI